MELRGTAASTGDVCFDGAASMMAASVHTMGSVERGDELEFGLMEDTEAVALPCLS